MRLGARVCLSPFRSRPFRDTAPGLALHGSEKRTSAESTTYSDCDDVQVR